jgi:hypothetical protein
VAELRARAQDRRPPAARDRRLPARARARPAFGEACWSLANLKTFRFEDSEVEAMRAQLARGEELPPQERHQFEFALGKALEDREDYAGSFAHYLQGNTLRRATVHYHADDTSTRVRRAKQLLDADFFRSARLRRAGPDPIFVLGLPRAGSTLIEQILSSHSQVEGTMELPEIISLTRGLRRMAEDPRSAATSTCSPARTPPSCARWASATCSARASTARPMRPSSSTRCRTTSSTSA